MSPLSSPNILQLKRLMPRNEMKSIGGKVSFYGLWEFGFGLLERCIHVCRQREVRKVQGESGRRIRPRDRAPRAMPAPEANAENQSNIDVSLSYNILSFTSQFHV